MTSDGKRQNGASHRRKTVVSSGHGLVPPHFQAGPSGRAAPFIWDLCSGRPDQHRYTPSPSPHGQVFSSQVKILDFGLAKVAAGPVSQVESADFSAVYAVTHSQALAGYYDVTALLGKVAPIKCLMLIQAD